MAWRTVTVADRRWSVAVAAERRAGSALWILVLAYRPADGGRTLWIEYGMESMSRGALYDQAERLSDAAITECLASRLGTQLA